MTISAGDIYGFIGENGAGKTTLMKIIAGLIRQTAGEIALFGKSGKSELNIARRQLGFLIESPAFYPNMTARENLLFYCRVLGIKDKDSRVKDVLKAVSLSDEDSKITSNYSLGMRQRLGIAIALLNEPEFLVLDEPINGLDPSGIVEIREILEKLALEKKVTILISSHILSELQLLATKFGFIHQGRLIKEITADELSKSAKTQICLKTPNSPQIIEILKKDLQIENVAVKESGEIEFPRAGVDIEKLMSVLLEKGAKIEGFYLSTPNLESYYMDLIGGTHETVS